MSTELKAKFTADATGFNSAMRGVEGSLGKIGGMLAGAFSIGALTGAISGALNFADELDNVAKSAMLSVEAVQVLKISANEAGQPFENLQGAVLKIQGAQFEALSDGASESAKSLQKMGLSMDDLAGMDTQQVIEAFTRRLYEGGDNADVLSGALDIIGARSAALLPILKQLGQEGFGGLAAEMKKAGMIVSEEDIARLDKAQLVIERTKMQGKATGTTWLADVLQNYQKAADLFAGKGEMREDVTFSELMKGGMRGGVAGMLGALMKEPEATKAPTGVISAPAQVRNAIDESMQTLMDPAAAAKASEAFRNLDRQVGYETLRTGGKSADMTDEMTRNARAMAQQFVDKLTDQGAAAPGDYQRAFEMFAELEQLKATDKTKAVDLPEIDNAVMVDRMARIGALSGRGQVENVQATQLTVQRESLAELRKLNNKEGELVLA